jgi:uncharacterized RDD family membrane protein YckC
LLASAYLVSFWTLTGQTPGMRFMGIRVVAVNGGPLGQIAALRRLVGMVLAAIPAGAGFLLVLVDDRRRGLHDRIGGSLVVHVARERHARAAPTSPPAQRHQEPGGIPNHV